MLAIALDTETTGLPVPSFFAVEMQPRIIEFAAVLFELETGNVVDEISEYVNPFIGIPRKITQLTGIRNSDVQSAPGWSDIAYMAEMLARQTPYVIAHNAAFDRAIIKYNCDLASLSIPFKRSHWVCTMVESQWIEGKPIKLSKAYGHLFGEDLQQTHRAREDVDALIKIAVSLHSMGGLV